MSLIVNNFVFFAYKAWFIEHHSRAYILPIVLDVLYTSEFRPY